jgi:hypothetical protein
MLRRFYRHATRHSSSRTVKAPRFVGHDPRGAVPWQALRNCYAPKRNSCAADWQACSSGNPENRVQGVRADQRNTQCVRVDRVARQKLAHEDSHSLRRRALYREQAAPARRRNPGFPTAQRLPSRCGNPASMPNRRACATVTHARVRPICAYVAQRTWLRPIRGQAFGSRHEQLG